MNARKNDDGRYQRLLDGFAAGDLDQAARRELLAWLDGDPWRWRRCALAMVEHRELEQALGDWTDEASISHGRENPSARRENPEKTEALPRLTAPSSRSKSTTMRGPNASPVGTRRLWNERFAMAALVLLAFGLGLAVRGSVHDPAKAIVKVDEKAARDGRSSPDASRLDGAAAAPQARSRKQTAQSDSQEDQPPTKTVRAETPTIHKSTADEPAVMPNDRNDAKSVAASPGPIPAYVRSQLERRGYRVGSRQALVPVALPDGRRVMLPVDKLQLSYVGLKSY
jgi:hypothetical protein